MKFTKMQGLGNDYVYVDCTKATLRNPHDLSVTLSDRHFGVGADGLICICPSNVADFRMDMYNADGSQSEMCGNGIRCVGKFIYDKGLSKKTTLRIETLAGIKTLILQQIGGQVQQVMVDMGAPGLLPAEVPMAVQGESTLEQPMEVAGQTYQVTGVSMGNPHGVIFLEDIDSLDLETLGAQFENHSLFPHRVNTEFIQMIDRRTLKMRVWERGSGETLACGTGACAAVVAAVLTGRAEPVATVQLKGGDLQICWDRVANTVFMTGPAVTVFEGCISEW